MVRAAASACVLARAMPVVRLTYANEKGWAWGGPSRRRTPVAGSTDPSATERSSSVAEGRDRCEVVAVSGGIETRVITNGEDIITAYPLL